MTKKYIPRDALPRIFAWMERPEVIAIKGPRQAGKTTLLEMLRNNLKGEKIFYFSFEDRNILSQFEDNPVEFIDTLLTEKKIFVFLDEYQYAKEGGQKLKLIYDKFKDKAKIIVTGSNSLELESATASYMVGRMLTINLYPLSFKEFLRAKNERIFKLWEKRNTKLKNIIESDDVFCDDGNFEDSYEEEIRKRWEEYCVYGGYPAVVEEENINLKKDLLDALVQNYINKDIISLLKREDVEKFRNLVQITARQTGQILNYNQLSADTGVYFEKVKHFLSILEETFLIKRVYPYYSNLTTELKKTPKCYFLDSGLRNSIIFNYGELRVRPDRGEIVESAVMFNIKASFKRGERVSFWRTAGGAEVDFVIQRGEVLIPVEIKHKKGEVGVSRSSYNFIEKYSPKNFFILTDGYCGKKKVKNTSIYFFPTWYFPFLED